MIVCMNYKMLEYDKIDISEGIDVNKTSASNECDICYYWCFLNKNFNCKPYLCNGCHDLIQKSGLLFFLIYIKQLIIKEI